MTESFSTRSLPPSCSFPDGGSLVRTYLSFRLSESKSVAFRFCSVILAEDPETIPAVSVLDLPSTPPRFGFGSRCLTGRELQASVDRHPGPLALRDVHGELQSAAVRVDAVGEVEAHLVRAAADGFGRVDQQPIQDVLVGEGGASCQNASVVQRLGVELPSAEFA